jgi:hypothetical protein
MFRFTIRDVLWVMVVAGLALAWWIDRGRFATPDVWQFRAEAAKEALSQAGWYANWHEDEAVFGSVGGPSFGYKFPYKRPTDNRP